MPVITSLPQSCGIHRKVTSLLWVRSDLITWLWPDKSRSSFSHDNFANNLIPSSSLEGDESGTVALVDTKNPESALSSSVHDRRITGFAFSAHRYSLIYWHGMCDYIHLKALFVFRVKNVRVLVLVFLSRAIIKNRVNQCLTFDMKCVNVQNTFAVFRVINPLIGGIFLITATSAWRRITCFLRLIGYFHCVGNVLNDDANTFVRFDAS